MGMPLDEVRKIFQQDKSEIIEKYSANGAGVGKDGEQYVIVLYVDQKRDVRKEQLLWKKIPLKFEYTGGFKLQ